MGIMEISKRKDVNIKEDGYKMQVLKPNVGSTEGRAKDLSNYDRDIMQALLNANPETALLIDKDGTVLITNYAAARRLGTSPERLIGSCLFDFFNPLEAGVVKTRVEEAIKQGKRVRSIDKHEDRYYDVHYYPISDENGEIERIAIFAIDVTKRKQTERALNSERLKFQVLADNIPLGIALIDKNDTYIYINPKFKELFGYDLEDIPNGEIWFKKAWPDPEYRHRVIATWLDNFVHFKPG
jgi:PAS domain S-box-containing protein